MPRPARYPTFEACNAVHLAAWKLIKGSVPLPAQLSGTASWETEDGPLQVTLTGKFFADGTGELWLAHIGRDRGRTPQEYVIRMEATRPQYGGLRWWFLCPHTGRRAAKLYLPRGCAHFATRHALPLGYVSQRIDAIGRAHRRVDRIERKLSGGTGNIHAPVKGRHRSTRQRLGEIWADEQCRLSEMIEAAFAGYIAKRPRMAGAL